MGFSANVTPTWEHDPIRLRERIVDVETIFVGRHRSNRCVILRGQFLWDMLDCLTESTTKRRDHLQRGTIAFMSFWLPSGVAIWQVREADPSCSPMVEGRSDRRESAFCRTCRPGECSCPKPLSDDDPEANAKPRRESELDCYASYAYQKEDGKWILSHHEQEANPKPRRPVVLPYEITIMHSTSHFERLLPKRCWSFVCANYTWQTPSPSSKRCHHLLVYLSKIGVVQFDISHH